MHFMQYGTHRYATAPNILTLEQERITPDVSVREISRAFLTKEQQITESTRFLQSLFSL